MTGSSLSDLILSCVTRYLQKKADVLSEQGWPKKLGLNNNRDYN